MDSIQRDWKLLPVEILQLIFQIVSKEHPKIESCNLALICKAWKDIAQAVSYSNITIKTLLQFKKLHDIIINSSHLGIKVRTLDLQFDLRENLLTEINLVNSLLTTFLPNLPNLEVLKKSNSQTNFPPLITLLNTQLKHLKRIQQEPHYFDGNEEFEGYVDCALLIKDRLENIYIMYTFPFERELYSKKLNLRYQRLYDNLYQFKNLVEISLIRETDNGIKVFEYIVESCKFLKKIDVDINILPKSAVFTDEVSKYTPNFNIKTLSIHIQQLKNDINLLPYIMHKFSHLKDLTLSLHENNSMVNIPLVAQLLDYISTIDTVYLGNLSTNRNNLLETIGEFWEKTSKLGTKNLHC